MYAFLCNQEKFVDNLYLLWYNQSEMNKKVIGFLIIAGLVYIFLLSINLMGAAFKLMGKDFASTLIKETTNPFIGLFIGILATSLVQSSSCTTSILVGLVAAGSITIRNAIPIVMGANIGTTITNIIVSTGHITRKQDYRRAVTGATVHDFFNLVAVAVLFPLEVTLHPIEYMAKFISPRIGHIQGAHFRSPLKLITQPVVESVLKFKLKYRMNNCTNISISDSKISDKFLII